jgi:predicted small secreted protein
MNSKAHGWLKAAAAAVLLAVFSIGAVGCHTVKGAGQDISSAGKTVQRSAEKASK